MKKNVSSVLPLNPHLQQEETLFHVLAEAVMSCGPSPPIRLLGSHFALVIGTFFLQGHQQLLSVNSLLGKSLNLKLLTPPGAC